MASYLWLYGDISRQDVEAIFASRQDPVEGSYLVRTRQAECLEYVLCVWFRGGCTHHLLRKAPRSQIFTINRRPCGSARTVAEAVEYLKGSVPFWPVRLIDPIQVSGYDLGRDVEPDALGVAFGAQLVLQKTQPSALVSSAQPIITITAPEHPAVVFDNGDDDEDTEEDTETDEDDAVYRSDADPRPGGSRPEPDVRPLAAVPALPSPPGEQWEQYGEAQQSAEGGGSAVVVEPVVAFPQTLASSQRAETRIGVAQLRRGATGPEDSIVDVENVSVPDAAQEGVVDKSTSLPVGWRQSIDEHGQVYFIDDVRKVTTFHDPRITTTPRGTGIRRSLSLHSLKQELDKERTSLVQGWRCEVDGNGRRYYINEETEEVKFSPPMEGQEGIGASAGGDPPRCVIQ